MTMAKLVRPALIAGALIMVASAHADAGESAADIIKDWAQGMANIIDTEKGSTRERYISAVLKNAKDRLAKVSCKDDKDVKGIDDLIKSARNSRKLPIEPTFKASCGPTHVLTNVDFTVKVNADTAQDAKDDAANLAKVTSAITAWGDTMRKAVDETHEQDKLKAKIDAATATVVKSLGEIRCRHTADANISGMVESEVSKRKLEITQYASGRCDEQKHTWVVEFKVEKFATAFDPKKDAANVGFSQGVLADSIVDEFFAKAKAIVNPPAIGWDKVVQQSQAVREKAGEYVARLNKIKCSTSDKAAGYVQDLITRKANEAHDYVVIDQIRVMCSGGTLNVSMNTMAAQAKVQPTLAPKAQATK